MNVQQQGIQNASTNASTPMGRTGISNSISYSHKGLQIVHCTISIGDGECISIHIFLFLRESVSSVVKDRIVHNLRILYCLNVKFCCKIPDVNNLFYAMKT